MRPGQRAEIEVYEEETEERSDRICGLEKRLAADGLRKGITAGFWRSDYNKRLNGQTGTKSFGADLVR